MFKKETCSLKIGERALSDITGIKDKIQKGIDEIEVNKNERIALRTDLLDQAHKLSAEIQKDEKNQALLSGKLEKLDALL